MGPAEPRLRAAAPQPGAEPPLAADVRGRRIDASTGIVAVLLYIAALVVHGTPPEAADTADEIGKFFTDKRDEILLASFLAGLAGAFFLWWLGSLRYWLKRGEAGEGRLSAAAFLAGGIAIALSLTGACVEAGLAFRVGGQGDQPLVRALFDIRSALYAMAGLGFAAMIAAASCSGARGGRLPRSAFWSGSVIAGLNAAAASALFAEKGFFATGGAMPAIALLTALGWFVAVALLMIRRPG